MLRNFALASVFAALALTSATHVEGMVAIAASVEDLAKASSLVAVAVPLEQSSLWEGGRIVTDSRVRIEECVADEGDAHRDAREVWVRTLGGVADGIGQRVEGEAQLVVSRPTLLFLRRGTPRSTEPGRETLVVVAHAQGQYDVESTPQTAARTLTARRGVFALERRWAPPLAAPSRPAMEILHGKRLDEAKVTILTAWRQTHAQ